MDNNSRVMNERVLSAMKKQSYEALHALDESTVNAISVNRELLSTLLYDNSDTEYGRKYHFSAIKDADDYRKMVPLTTYEDYETFIDRMTENGEKNLLTAYPVVYYASTSGTSGSPKKIPVTDRGLDVFRKYASSVMLAVISEFYQNTKYQDAPAGLRMMMINFSRKPLPNGVDFGSISAACMTEKSVQRQIVAIKNARLFPAQGTTRKVPIIMNDEFSSPLRHEEIITKVAA